MHPNDLTLVDGLFQLSFALQDRLARVGAEHELSTIQLRLLGILRDREPAMNELARYLHLEKSSLSGLVDRASKRGLVERLQSKDDRRGATVRLTSRGRTLAQALARQAGVEVDALVAVLGRAEQKQLRALVSQVVLDAGSLPVDEA